VSNRALLLLLAALILAFLAAAWLDLVR